MYILEGAVQPLRHLQLNHVRLLLAGQALAEDDLGDAARSKG